MMQLLYFVGISIVGNNILTYAWTYNNIGIVFVILYIQYCEIDDTNTLTEKAYQINDRLDDIPQDRRRILQAVSSWREH